MAMALERGHKLVNPVITGEIHGRGHEEVINELSLECPPDC